MTGRPPNLPARALPPELREETERIRAILAREDPSLSLSLSLSQQEQQEQQEQQGQHQQHQQQQRHQVVGGAAGGRSSRSEGSAAAAAVAAAGNHKNLKDELNVQAARRWRERLSLCGFASAGADESSDLLLGNRVNVGRLRRLLGRGDDVGVLLSRKDVAQAVREDRKRRELLNLEREKERQQNGAGSSAQLAVKQLLRKVKSAARDLDPSEGEIGSGSSNLDRALDKGLDELDLYSLFCLGLPVSLRGQIWVAVTPNAAQVTVDLFNYSRTRAAARRSELLEEQARVADLRAEGEAVVSKKDSADTTARESSVTLIALDLERTFPVLSFFSEESPLFSDLRDVLEAYVSFRPDIGYVQGMSFLGAMLLLNVSAFEAFMVLCNILQAPMFQAFFRVTMEEMERYFAAFERALREVSPSVAANLQRVGVTPQFYLVDWILTIFSRSLPLEVSARVWDHVLLDGESAILRAALAVMKYFEDELSTGDQEECLTLMTHLEQQNGISEEKLFKTFFSISFGPDRLRELLSKE